MTRDTSSTVGTVVMVCLFFVGLFGFIIFSASQEAATFNKLAKPDVEVTWWDALWVELRVDDD